MINEKAMQKLSYGLFVLTAKDGEKDNGCIINTAIQVTSDPLKILIAVNKGNFTHDMIMKTKEFNISALDVSAPFYIFKQFGFQSGRDVDKFKDFNLVNRSENGIYRLSENINSFISGKVVETVDCGTHTVFFAEVTETEVLNDVPSLTYAYYFQHTKPAAPAPVSSDAGDGEKKKIVGWVCKICGYVYEGETLPADFICPICKHPAADFDPIFG